MRRAFACSLDYAGSPGLAVTQTDAFCSFTNFNLTIDLPAAGPQFVAVACGAAKWEPKAATRTWRLRLPK